jgi:hypothetical protein
MPGQCLQVILAIGFIVLIVSGQGSFLTRAQDPGKEPTPAKPVEASAILIDIKGDGFELTNAEGGTQFDLDGDGTAETSSWTAIASDDAWLGLD